MSLPPRHQHKKSRASLIFSVVFHVVVVGVAGWFAAREGVLGTKLREITAVQNEEKKPEPEKPKPAPEPVKQAPDVKPAVEQVPQNQPPPQQDIAPPPPSDIPPPADAPPADASDGPIIQAQVATGTTDPIQAFKDRIQYLYQTKWNKPDTSEDSAYVAEAEIWVDSDGRVSNPRLEKGSGDTKWDATVQAALSQVKHLGERPPPSFPSRIRIRFDTVAVTENVQ